MPPPPTGNWLEKTTHDWAALEWTSVVLIGVAFVALLCVRLFRRMTTETQSSNGDTASAPSSPTAPHSVSWTKRRLFDAALRTDSPVTDSTLPRVEPHEIPSADSSDLVFGRLTPVFAQLFPDSEKRREAVKKELKAAGYHTPHASQNLAAIRYVAMMLPLLLFGSLLVIAPVAFEIPLLIAMVLFCSTGWAMPRLYVRSKADQRTASIEHAMPDMLDMLNMCVSQGLTVQESLRRISRELRRAYPDLSRELNIVCEQSTVGRMEHALKNFAERIDVPEVQSFSSLLIQTERMGTSVSKALAEYSDNFRETHRQQADQKANNATFKLLFPTVLCLMPAVYMFLLGPPIIELSDFFHGGGRDAIDGGREALDQLNQQR